MLMQTLFDVQIFIATKVTLPISFTTKNYYVSGICKVHDRILQLVSRTEQDCVLSGYVTAHGFFNNMYDLFFIGF